MKNPETAKRLKEALSLAGITAKQLSDKSGVSQSSISQYTHGTYIPNNVTAAKMAEVLNVSPVWLMGFDVPMIEEEMRSYYLNPQTAEIAQAIFDSKELSLLFSEARDAKPEDLMTIHTLLLALKAKERS